jgi:hypothetical protein
MHRIIRSRSPLILGMFGLIAGCTETSGPSARSVNQLPSLIVSSPESQSAGASADVVGGAGWVSLPPGSVPDGQSATIRNERSGANIIVTLVDGGFDPIAIEASVDDTVFVDITRSGNRAPLTGFQVIAIRKAPSVVRTSPTPGKKDVPLNAAIVAVFSAPIDPATLSPSSFGLLRGSTPVPGSVRLVGTSGISAEFVPDSALAPLTSYQLFVTQTIHDVNGVPLAPFESITFSTDSSPGASGPLPTQSLATPNWTGDAVVVSATLGSAQACGWGTSPGEVRNGVEWLITDTPNGISLDEDLRNSPTDDVPNSGHLAGTQFSATYTAGADYADYVCQFREATISGSFTSDSTFEAVETLVWGRPEVETTVHRRWTGSRL